MDCYNFNVYEIVQQFILLTVFIAMCIIESLSELENYATHLLIKHEISVSLAFIDQILVR